MTNKNINEFDLISVLDSGDFVLVWDSSEGITNKASVSQITNQILSGITIDTITDGTTYKKFLTTERTRLANTSGTNTGDESVSTIKSKLGISTLSGSNTGDQDLSGYTLTSGLATVATTGVIDDLDDGIDYVKSHNDLTDTLVSNISTNNAKVSFPEALSDGKQYARKDGAWEEVVASGSGGAPNTYNIISVDSSNTSPGTSGSNRTITLNNSALTTSSGMMVFKGSQFVHPQYVTITNLSTSSTILFLIPVINGESITVIYYDA